jgi:hypothetical protein
LPIKSICCGGFVCPLSALLIAEYHSIGEFPNTNTAIHASKKAGHNEGHPEKHSLLKPHVVVASSVLRRPRSNGELGNNQSTSTTLKKAKLNIDELQSKIHPLF